MGLPALEFSDCCLDSPRFRETLKSHEEELDKTNKFIQELLKDGKSLIGALKNISKEINLMLSTYAKVLSERAAVDASYIHEIDELVKEANTIENFLVQKRELLKQRFTVIANTLHS